jgi:hypothetical protein
VAIDIAALGHAIHAAIRPTALLPVEAQAHDPFTMALRRIEFESGRLMQAQFCFSRALNFSRSAMPLIRLSSSAIRKSANYGGEMLEGIGVQRTLPDPE